MPGAASSGSPFSGFWHPNRSHDRRSDRAYPGPGPVGADPCSRRSPSARQAATIEEKALGNLEKIGKKIRFLDVLEPAEAPARGAGLYFMDTSSAAAECCTLQAAAGYVIHCFPTGQGNVIGNPIMPVIKISGNPRTVRVMSEHIDVDVSGIVRREMTIDQAGDLMIDTIARTANGRFTAAEALGHREFVMTKLYRSA